MHFSFLFICSIFFLPLNFLSINISLSPCLCMSCLSIYLSVCPSVCLSVLSLSLYIYIYIFVCRSESSKLHQDIKYMCVFLIISLFFLSSFFLIFLFSRLECIIFTLFIKWIKNKKYTNEKFINRKERKKKERVQWIYKYDKNKVRWKLKF